MGANASHIPWSELSEAQKEAKRRYWNNRIAMHYGGNASLLRRVHWRRALRTFRR